MKFEHPTKGTFEFPQETHLDINTDPNVVGEFLRDYFFVDGYGAYSTFDLIKGMMKVDCTKERFTSLFCRPSILDDNRPDWMIEDKDVFEHSHWYVDPSTDIEVGWFWDGDGVLCFRIPYSSCEGVLNYYTLLNTDCKKSQGWEWYEKYYDGV